MRNIFGTLGRFTAFNNIDLNNNNAVDKPNVTASSNRNGSTGQITIWDQTGPSTSNTVTINNIWTFLRQVFILGFENKASISLQLKDGDKILNGGQT